VWPTYLTVLHCWPSSAISKTSINTIRFVWILRVNILQALTIVSIFIHRIFVIHTDYLFTYFKVSVCIFEYIQGDSGGIRTTLGNDSMSDSKQKVHHEHGSDFERLRSYGHFLIPVHALMWTELTEPAGGWWLTVCIASITFASWLDHPATDSPVSVSRHLGNKRKGVGIRLATSW
jgi:hypothetical protein